MDARMLLERVAQAFAEAQLEAVMIGNAAAIHGAPVSTVDIDFYYRDTASNRKKLEQVARFFGTRVTEPFNPVSGLIRIDQPTEGLQLDFMSFIGTRHSFEGVRQRAQAIGFGRHPLLVASLEDIIKSKRSAKRPKDLAVLHEIEATLAQKENHRRPA